MTLHRLLDVLVELRTKAAAARTAPGADDPVSFPLVPSNVWNERHEDNLEIVVDMSALTLGTAANARISVEIDSDSGFSSPIEAARLSLSASTLGRFILTLSLETVKQLESAAAYIRTNLLGNSFNGVASVTVTSGGSGYTSPPTVSFSGGGGSGAAATATVVANVVTAVTVTNPGSGYTSPPTVSFSGGGGTGAAATAVLGPTSIDFSAFIAKK